ncbi:MAG: NUDIX hydrolase [Patescibacteria group bacterium]|nr:NUDIX hydrolase [Patescibacteria group bacterium]
MNPDRGYRKANMPEGAKRVFEGKIFDVYQWEQELYDGSTTIFERITRPDTVVVFPVLQDGRILLIEDSQPDRETVLTPPSGRIEEGETPENAARRELLEETGHSVEALHPLFAERPLNKLDWMIYGFIGRGAKKVREPTPDAGEKIALRPLSFEEMIETCMKRGRGFKTDFGNVFFEALLDSEKMDALKKSFFG